MHPDRCTQQAASNSLVNPRLSWDAQNKRKRQPSLFPYGPTAPGLYKKRRLSSYHWQEPSCLNNSSCLHCQWQKEGWGRRKGNENLKSKVSWWKKGFRKWHSNRKLGCSGSNFSLPQSYIPVWDSHGLQSPHTSSHSCICPKKTIEWARGFNGVYCSLHVRAASSALWALRGTVKSGAGFPSHRAVTHRYSEHQLHSRKYVTLIVWHEAWVWAALRGDSTPVLQKNCSVAQEEQEMTQWQTLSGGGS